MDYRTFFFTNIASVLVFTACVSVLAWRNRSIKGMIWFAAALQVGLVKLVLQGLEGTVSPVFGSLIPNELYLIASALQFMGLYWFAVRKPLRLGWPVALLVLLLAVYSVMFLRRIPYTANLMNLPNVAVNLAAAWVLLRSNRSGVSRVSAIIAASTAAVMAYRAWLTNLRYIRPWETVHAQTDPRWIYSLALLAFLATCMVMCDLWYLVNELSRVLALQARTDPLTGAFNRRAMEEIALRETSRSIRHGNPLCMIVLDVDRFKLLNDTHGHAAGDCALQALVTQIKSMLRVNDVLARTGGEEFTVLLPHTSASAGILAAERVRQAIENLETLFDNMPLKFTVSAGVAQLDPSQGSWESMMRSADSAMYQAKEHGRTPSARKSPIRN